LCLLPLVNNGFSLSSFFAYPYRLVQKSLIG
jgi:hypothetical protein